MDPFITFRYTDGRPVTSSEVHQQCSAAHRYIEAGIAQPKTQADLETYRGWLDEHDRDEPDGLVGAWAVADPEPDDGAVAGEVVAESGPAYREDADEETQAEPDDEGAGDEPDGGVDGAEPDDGDEEADEDGESSDQPEEAGPVDATAAARDLAAEHGIDLRSVEGSGQGGRIVVFDVKAAINE